VCCVVYEVVVRNMDAMQWYGMKEVYVYVYVMECTVLIMHALMT
jgi:hypothetical protein